LWAVKAKNGGKFPVHKKQPTKPATTTKTKPFGKGQRTVVSPKSPRFYPTEKVIRARKSHKTVRPAKIRDSLQEGTVAIVLSGKFRGKRVVVLKRLPSGLLLVSGMLNPSYLSFIRKKDLSRLTVFPSAVTIPPTSLLPPLKLILMELTLELIRPNWRMPTTNALPTLRKPRRVTLRTR
jgi:hypothetical protein